MSVSGWLWEHGAFGLSSVKRKKIGQIGEQSPPEHPGDWVEWVKYHRDGSQTRTRMRPLACQSSLSRTATEKTRTRRGLRGMTSHGRKVVTGAAHRIESLAPRYTVSFVTLTLPAANQAQLNQVARSSPKWLKVLCQRVARSLRKQKLPGHLVAVLEIQPKRAASTGLYALHVHMVFQGRRGGKAWVLTPVQIRDIWRNTLRRYHSFYESANFDSSENVQCVKQSASGYLGKYLSKGGAEVAEAAEKCPDALPSSWYYCSLALRRAVLGARVRLSGGMAEQFLRAVERGFEGLLYLRRVTVTSSDGTEFGIGTYGRLLPRCVPEWREVCDADRKERGRSLSWVF